MNNKFIIFICFLVFLSPKIFAQNTMSIGSYSGSALDTVSLSIIITNTQNFTAFQTDIQLPTQVTYLNGSAQLSVRANGHSLSASLLDNNILRVIAFSTLQNNFNGNSGSVLDFKVILSTQPGNYPLQLSNCIISDSASHNILTSSSNGSITIITPDISVSSNSLDFNRTPLNSYTDRTFTINNNGNSNLIVSRIFTDNNYFQLVGDTSFTINSGSSKDITVRFNSLKKGNYNSHLYINSNDPDQAQTAINLTAISFAVNELHMQNVSGRSGYSVSISFSINNMERFVGFQFDLLLPSVLSFIKDSVQLSTRKDDHIVSANLISPGRLRVLAFSPTNKSFYGNDGDVVTINFMLKGTGGNYSVNLDSVIITDSTAANIVSDFYSGNVNIKSPSLSGASSFNFPDAAVTDTASFVYRIDNYGNDTLNINSFSSQQNYFWNTTQLPQVIPPGSYQNFNLKFHNGQRGNYTGSFTVRSNDPLNDPFVINASANSFEPNYIIAENTNAFSGDTAIVKIDVQNYEPCVALQVDLQMPDSLTYINNSAYLTNRNQGHSLSVGSLGNNKYKILVFSLTQSQFIGDSGAIVVLKFKVGNATGNFPISLSNGILSNASSQNILRSTQDGSLSLYGTPGIINLTSPINGSSSVLLNSNLNWSTGSNSSSYEVQVALDSLFSSIVIDSSGISNTSMQLSRLMHSVKYFWKVRGYNLGNFGNWSIIWNFTTITNSSITGTVSYNNLSSTALSNVGVKLVFNGNQIDSTISDSSGQYTFNNLSNGTYQLKLATTIPWGGVNSTDALIIKRQVVGLDTLSGLRLSAADVNASGTVNSTDALVIQRRVVSLITSFAPGGDWVFDSSSVTLSGSSVTQNIQGLSVGDVNGSYNPVVSKAVATIQMDNEGTADINPGEEFDIPVNATSDMQLGAITLILSYPSDLVEVEEVTGKEAGILYNSQNGKLAISWCDLSPLNLKSGEPLFTIKFRPTESFKLGSALSLSIDPLSELADINAKVLNNVRLNIPTVEATIPKEYQLSQNYPNPFNPSTIIEYDLPEQARVTLEVFNVLGEKVTTIENSEKAAGSYKITWKADNLASGIYLFRMTAQGKSKEFIQIKKMMLLK